MPEPASARVFFALWPDPAVRRALTQVGLKLHRQVDGKMTHEASVHMTLLFLGEVSIDRLGVLTDLAAGIPFEAFRLQIDKADCWKHNRIAWVAPSVTPPALTRLVEALERRAGAEGFGFDLRPFAPHVTLVRKARCAPLDLSVPEIQWEVRDFVLVRSDLDSNGSRYRQIGRWPPVSQAGPSV